MWFGRLTTSVVAGTAGFVACLWYHKLPVNHQQSLAKFEKPVQQNVFDETDALPEGAQSVLRFNVPSCESLTARKDFVLCYDKRNKIPLWVMEHLTRDMIFTKTAASRLNSKFFEDSSVHPYFRASTSDYSKSGYDRGHLAAAAHHKHSQETVDDTFVLSNVAPQVPKFNQNTWSSLERRIGKLVQEHGSVYVCSGPLFLPTSVRFGEKLELDQTDNRKRKKIGHVPSEQTEKKYMIYEVIGDNGVAVPTHFFKVILCENEDGRYDMESYIMPNKAPESRVSLDSFLAPRESIERAAGFFIFDNLPDSFFRSINCKNIDSDDCNRDNTDYFDSIPDAKII